jgi:hypothetical protein
MKTMGNSLKKCPICRVLFVGYGNNAFPLNVLGKCCDSCNMEFVLPARIAILINSTKKDNG